MRTHRLLTRKSIIVSTLLFVVSLVTLCFANLDPAMCAFINRLLRSDIYEQVSSGQPFAIWESNATVREQFIVPYTNTFVVALHFEGKYPPLFYKPRGVVQIQYYQGDRLLRDVLYENHRELPNEYAFGKCKAIILDEYTLPQHFGTSSHSVVVRVIEPDAWLEEFRGHMRVVVRGSPYW